MRICIFAEGNYPYVLGGVSSWIDTLVRSCPEHEFIIYAISADTKNSDSYKYRLPGNVTQIVDAYLDQINLIGGKKGKRYRLGHDRHHALRQLLIGNTVSWNSIFEIFRDIRFERVTDFFMSKNFYDLVIDMYAAKYPYTPFTEFVWTVRSMYVVLFYLLMQDMPKADVYHSVSTGYAGVLASYAKFLNDKPFLLSEHGIYTREREEEIIKSNWVRGYYKDIWISYFYALSGCAYNAADMVISLFDINKELQVEIGCPEEKIRIIPNGIDVSEFEHIPEKQDDSSINIGAIIRVAPIKDIKTMLQSFYMVKKEIKNARFYIMGPTDEEPEYYKECLELARHLDIQDLEFTATVNIRDYIGKMDVLVITSISEGQPLAVMEGMAARKPHVCTNVGDCKGLLEGKQDIYGQAGFVEYIMDQQGIAQSIIRLCRDEDLRTRMGLNGYNRIANLYRKEDFVKNYKEIYKELGERMTWQA